MTRIFGIGHIGEAIGADAHVRTDKHAVPRMSVAGNNNKSPFSGHSGKIFTAQRGQPRQRRQLFLQALAKTLHLILRALNFHAHAVRSIAHASCKPALVGQPVDKGPKAHSLNLAGSHKGAP